MPLRTLGSVIWSLAYSYKTRLQGQTRNLEQKESKGENTENKQILPLKVCSSNKIFCHPEDDCGQTADLPVQSFSPERQRRNFTPKCNYYFLQ